MELQVYIVNFDTEIFKITADVVIIEYDSSDEQYQKLCEILDSDGLDIIDYNDDIAILVDDRGFEKKNNPIFNVLTEDGVTCQLAGVLIFIRNIYNEYSTDFGSIKYEDIFNLRRLLDIKVVGAIL